METYAEAANKCVNSATAFMEHARLFAEAKRAYELYQKEIELVRVRKEIDALKLVIPLLVEDAAACQIEYVSCGSSVSIPCGKPPLLSVQTVELPFVPIAESGAAANHSVKSVIAT
jgi:hypothetical protein